MDNYQSTVYQDRELLAKASVLQCNVHHESVKHANILCVSYHHQPVAGSEGTTLKAIMKLKTRINLLLCGILLALVYYTLNNARFLEEYTKTRNAVWMYKGEISVKTHRSDSVYNDSVFSSVWENDTESDSEWNDANETESAENGTVRAPEGRRLEENPRGGISSGGIHRTVSVSSRSEPVVIIILAQWRFGSSVIGELFNQNPGIFFMFEPLWVVEKMVTLWRLPGPFAPETYFYQTKVMRDFAKCDFSDEFIGVVNLTNHWGGKMLNRAICKRTGNGCKIPNAEWLSNVCKSFEGHLAAKLIRGDFDTIKPLIVDDHVNVKVIHLVRDPRGSAASRINYLFNIAKNGKAHPKYSKVGRLEPLQLFNFDIMHSDSIIGMCRWLRETTNTSAKTSDWLIDRYYLLKYEDFANDPIRVTEDLYNFAGLQLPHSVKKWVSQNTQAKSSAQGTFAMKKNSNLTATHWMHDLGYIEIQQIEAECSDVMKILGYELYDNLQH
nr:carbohydrate sulfotransferase 3-like [Lytechinus pictus]